MGWIRNKVIGEDKAKRIYDNGRSAISSGRNLTSGCISALRDDLRPGCLPNISRLSWITNQVQLEVKQPKEPQICTSIRDFYAGGDMSIGKFGEFHDLQKQEGTSCLGNLLPCFNASKSSAGSQAQIKSETDASKLSAGSQVQKNQTSSCWSFFRLSSNPELKKYCPIDYDKAKTNKEKLVKNQGITLEQLQGKLLSLLSDNDVRSGLDKGGVIQELRKEYKSSKIDLLFNAINKKPDIEKKVFLQKLIRKINLSITYPNNHSIAMFINKELQDRKIKQDPSKVTAAIVMVR